MKQTPLKRKTPLRAKTGFKVKSITFNSEGKSIKLKNGFTFLGKNRALAVSCFSRNRDLTPQQEADSVFSKFIRRSAIFDNEGNVSCVTCPKIDNWQNMQCGHFRRRANLTTRYLESNCGVQCEDCNCYKDGKEEEFAEYIDRKHGAGTAEYLTKLSHQIATDVSYETIIENYSKKLKDLVAFQDSVIKY